MKSPVPIACSLVLWLTGLFFFCIGRPETEQDVAWCALGATLYACGYYAFHALRGES